MTPQGATYCKYNYHHRRRHRHFLYANQYFPEWNVFNQVCEVLRQSLLGVWMIHVFSIHQYSTVFHSAHKYSTVFSIAYFWPLARSSWAIGKNKGVKMPTSSFSHQEAPKVPWTLFCIYFVPLWYLQYWSCLWQPTMDWINMQLLDCHHSYKAIVIIIYINIRILYHQHKIAINLWQGPGAVYIITDIKMRRNLHNQQKISEPVTMSWSCQCRQVPSPQPLLQLQRKW